MTVNSTIGLIPGTSQAKIGAKAATYLGKLTLRTAGDTAVDTVTREGDAEDYLISNTIGNIVGDSFPVLVKKYFSKTAMADQVVDGVGKFLQKKLADPNTIRFTQDSISPTFKNKQTIQPLVNDLKSGKINTDDIPPIRIFEKGGKTFTLDNRRLKAFQESNVPIRTIKAMPKEISDEAWKFTTKTNGLTIKIRGGGL